MAVHAHPDDEATTTGGLLAKAASEGIRTVLVTCTDGACGDAPGGVKPGEAGHDPAAVVDLRMVELQKSAEILGVTHLELLGYADSGMDGWEQNNAPGSFWSTPVEEGAAHHRLEEAHLATLDAPPGDVAVDELRQAEKTRSIRECRGFRVYRRVRRLDEDDVVRDQVPILPCEHPTEAAGQEEIVRVQYGDERRRGPRDGVIAREGRPPVPVEGKDGEPSRAVIRRKRGRPRPVGRTVIHHDDFRHLRFGQC